MPRDEGTFILDTDASDHSIGAVLSQLQDGQERVIAYAAKVLQPAQVKYCAYRRELLATITFVKHFRNYLLGHHWLLRTDNAALSWLRKHRDPVGQNARWIELLEEYDYEVQHRPGVRHANADALSRIPCPPRTPCTACKPTSEVVECNAVRPVSAVSQALLEESAGETSFPGLWTPESLVDEQKSDPEIKWIYAAMEESPEQPSSREVMLWPREAKMLWYQWSRLSLRNGILYRKWDYADGIRSDWQLIVPVKFRQELFQQAHAGMSGGHLGLQKTETQLQRRMYWPTWRTDAKLWIKWCHPCAQFHRGSPPRQAELNPFPASYPFEVMSMDITGPHPKSREGNEYIMTVVDSFSKFAEAFPIRVHTAQVVAKRLVDGVFSRYGVPLRLLSDQGPEFESALIRELCKSYGIEKLRTTGYQPRTNGACERFHRTLNSMLAKVVSESQRDWDKHVAPVMAAYRSTVHRSTGYSPNFIIYGRENRAPVDLVLAVGDEHPDIGSSPDAYVQELLERQRKAYDIARLHLGQAAERRKREYDFRVKHRDFHVDQWVWYLYPRRYKGRLPKWSRQYTGPYLVVREIPPCNFVIQRSQRSKTMVVHADKLKACFGDTPKSWLSEPSPEPTVQIAAEETESVHEVFGDGTPLMKRHSVHDAGTRSQPAEEACEDDRTPILVDDVWKPADSPSNRRFRDRNRLKRPARYNV